MGRTQALCHPVGSPRLGGGAKGPLTLGTYSSNSRRRRAGPRDRGRGTGMGDSHRLLLLGLGKLHPR